MADIQIMTAMNKSVINKITEFKNKEQKEIENEILHKNDKYKLAQFENIPSKLKENTKNWITNEKTKLKPIKKTNTPLIKNKNKSQNKPMTSINPSKPSNGMLIQEMLIIFRKKHRLIMN